MSAEPMLSYEREAWVILNGCGQLWTDRVFDTETQAIAYVDRYWRDAHWTGPQHRPVRAWVRLSAEILARLIHEDGGPGVASVA